MSTEANERDTTEEGSDDSRSQDKEEPRSWANVKVRPGFAGSALRRDLMLDDAHAPSG